MESNTLRIGRHVAAVINQNQCVPTNVYQLNTVMFLSIGEAIQEKKYQFLIEDLYDEPFEFWSIGPMHRSITKKLKSEKVEKFALYDEELSFLDPYIIKYTRIRYYEFLGEVIQFDTWKNNEEKIENRKLTVKYPIHLIKKDIKKWLNK